MWHLATTSFIGFFGALALFTGYAFGVATMLVVVLKPIFPANAGLWLRDGVPISFGALFPAPENAVVADNVWIYVAAGVLGLALLVLTHLAARRWIAWLRRPWSRPA